MSSQKKGRDIVRLRTFADDFNGARSQETQNVKQTTTETIVPSSKTPEGKVAIPKKEASYVLPSKESLPIEENLQLKDNPIFYNAENAVVPDITYEENVAVARESKQEEKLMEIPSAEEVSVLTEKPKSSILTDNLNEVSDVESGTIIRDTKRKRFHLLPAMVGAIKKWFTQKKEDYEESRVEKYTVEKAEDRVATIKAAVKKQMQAPDEDYAQVTKRLKEVKREVPKKTALFKPKESIPDPQWSHTIDENALEEQVKTETKPALVKQEEDKIYTHEKENGPQLIKESPKLPVFNKKESLPTHINHSTQHVKEVDETVNTMPQTEEPVSKITPPVTVPNVESAPQESTVEKEDKKSETTPVIPSASVSKIPRQTYAYAPYEPPVAKFPFKLLVIVVAVAVLFGTGVSIFFFGTSEKPIGKALVFRVPSLISTQVQIPISFSLDHTILFNEILTNVVDKNDIAQIYPTETTEYGERAVSNKDIAQVVAPDAPGSFIRSITDITFGRAQGQPFIIMRVTNFDVGFAGMLQWERAMSADLSPLFGATVIESFDPYARTDTQVRNAFFKDTFVSNYNVRLLIDETGEDRIIYAFIDKNTILITTTKNAFELLAPLVR